MKITESRNKREGRYAGCWFGEHRRTRCVPEMINVSAAQWQRHKDQARVRAHDIYKELLGDA